MNGFQTSNCTEILLISAFSIITLWISNLALQIVSEYSTLFVLEVSAWHYVFGALGFQFQSLFVHFGDLLFRIFITMNVFYGALAQWYAF